MSEAIMIGFIFFFITALVAIGVRFNKIKTSLLFPILLGLYLTSLTPSLDIPYIIDDVDHLYNLAQAMETSRVGEWFLTPHNEHVIPMIKLLYYLFYKNFWVFPQAFHVVIMILMAGILFLIYQLLFRLTQSSLSAFIGCSVVASTNLMDNAIFVITDTHILFCVFFFLLLFLSQYQYTTTQRPIWLALIFLSTVLSPSTFALGLTSLFFAFLFGWLCCQHSSKTFSKMMLVVFSGWALSLIPYLVSLGQIIYTPHYKDIGGQSAFDIMNIHSATVYFVIYIFAGLIPQVLAPSYISMGVFFIVSGAALYYRKSVTWRPILFFLCWGSILSLVIFTFRIAWGPAQVGFARYDVLPVIMLAGIYALILNSLFQDERITFTHPRYHYLIYLVCFFLMSLGGMNRYTQAFQIASETTSIIQNFYLKFRYAFESYIKETQPQGLVQVKNVMLIHPTAPSLTNKAGLSPLLTRYPRSTQFYAQYILPPDIRKKFVWGEKTDELLLNYFTDPRHQKLLEDFYDVYK